MKFEWIKKSDIVRGLSLKHCRQVGGIIRCECTYDELFLQRRFYQLNTCRSAFAIYAISSSDKFAEEGRLMPLAPRSVETGKSWFPFS